MAPAVEPSPKAARRLVRGLEAAIGGCLAAAAVAGALELAARAAWGPPPPSPLPSDFGYLHLETLRPFFARERLGPGRVRVVPARRRARAAAFVDPKPPGTLRVFLAGGSVAARFDPRSSRLAEFLGRALPGRRVEIVDCGMGAYDSARDEAVLREILDHEPDLVVLMSGNNEAYGGDVAYPRLVLLDRRLRRLWTYRALAAAVRPLVRRRPAAEAAEGIDRRFERRLRAMARRCRTRGVPLALCTLGANLRDAPPSRLPGRDAEYLEGVARLESGRAAAAAAVLRRYAARRPEDPWGRFYLARSLDRLGERAVAAGQYRIAADLDLLAPRTPPRRNRIIRAVAAEEGAILVDLERLFESLAPLGVPGDAVFQDACHWMEGYYPLVGATLLRAVYAHDLRGPASVLAPAAAWRPDRLPDPAALRRPKESPEARARDFRDGLISALMMIGEAPADAFSEPAVHLLGRQLARNPERLAAAIGPNGLDVELEREDDEFRRYRERFPGAWPRVRLHVREAYRRAGRTRKALDGEASLCYPSGSSRCARRK